MTTFTLETRPGTARRGNRLRAILILLATALVASALALAPLGATGSASAASAVSQCNGVYNAAAAQVECEVKVVNTINVSTGVGSSTVSVGECVGAPGATVCRPLVVTSYASITTSVDQCNGSGNSGGGVVICAVQIINEITGTATTTPATVNQCAGSGAGGGVAPLNCDTYATTTGATITQCNGSVNGGGAPTRVNCSLASSTEAALIPVSVNQCNGSANGGGARMFCTVQVVNRGASVTYTGPALSTTLPVVLPASGGIVLVPVVTPGVPSLPTPVPSTTPTPPSSPAPPTSAPVPNAPSPSSSLAPNSSTTPTSTNATSTRPGAAAALELAATGTDTVAPATISLLLLVAGGTLSLVALARRSRKRHV